MKAGSRSAALAGESLKIRVRMTVAHCVCVEWSGYYSISSVYPARTECFTSHGPRDTVREKQSHGSTWSSHAVWERKVAILVG